MSITKNEQKRRFLLILSISLIAALAIVILTFYLRSDSRPAPPSNIKVVKKESIQGGIGAGSKAYNEKLEKLDEKQTEDALVSGESYISIPVAKRKPLLVKKDTPPPPAPKRVRQPKTYATRDNKKDEDRIKNMMNDLKKMESSLGQISTSGGSIFYTMDSSDSSDVVNKPSVIVPANAKNETKTDLRAGDVLYAIVDTSINSDVPSAVMCTVAAGKYRKARLIGKFTRFDHQLILAFNRMILPEKGSIQIEAYAIDPATTQAAVASRVNTRFFSRWGGLIAASFLDGIGEAKKYSGAEGLTNAFGESTDRMVWKDYDTADQAWIAAGKVGKKAGSILERSFERPPTVYLDSGTEIGVLILNIAK